MIKIYGNIRSRANRCLWLLNEIGAEYQHVSFEFGSQQNRTEEYLALNPAGKVPTMTDGDIVMFESIAINLYLAERYGDDVIWPKIPSEHALVLQWSLWAVAELEPHVVTMAVERVFKPEPARNAVKADEAEATVKKVLPVLEKGLSGGRSFVASESFSVADLNVASVLTGLRLVQFDFSPWPNVEKWFSSALSRPAFAKAMGR